MLVLCLNLVEYSTLNLTFNQQNISDFEVGGVSYDRRRGCVSLLFKRNRELEVLCSCHSICVAFVLALSSVGYSTAGSHWAYAHSSRTPIDETRNSCKRNSSRMRGGILVS